MSDVQFFFAICVAIAATYLGLRLTAALEEIACNLSRIRIEWDNDDDLSGEEWKRNGDED